MDEFFQDEMSPKIDSSTDSIRLIKFFDDYIQYNDTNVKDRVAVDIQYLEKLFKKVESTRGDINNHNHDTSFLFNFFDIFRVNENSMSKILAFMLNPKGKHGQGDIYFKEFCEYFDLIIPPYESFHIRCEESTDINRRIDLLIKVGDFFIIIENKFRGAVDQKHQLKHYYEYIMSKAKSTENIYLFYMNQNGDEPSEYTFPRTCEEDISVWEKLKTSKKLITVPFKNHLEHQHSIYKYLEICKNKTKSAKMQFFIEDIMHHISRENKMNKHREQMFQWLSESSERTENAYDIFRLWNDYRKFIIDKFFATFDQNLSQALNNKFEGSQFKIEKYGDFMTKNHSGYRICVYNDYHVYLQSDSAGFDNIHYGFGPFHDNDKNVLHQKNIELKLHDELLANFNKSGSKTPFSIVKYQSKESRFGSIENLKKLLPKNNMLPENDNALMETWINELIGLTESVMKSEIFRRELCQTQKQLTPPA